MMALNDTVFVLVDVQGRLAQIMHEKEPLFANLQRAVQGMKELQIPILWLEQIPEKMGETIPELKALLAGEMPLAKTSFGACGDAGFMARLQALGRKNVVLGGIETHVCVYQTAAELVRLGYHVEVLGDGVSSRSAANRAIGLEKIRTAGAQVTCVETVLFELMRTAEHPAFKAILKVVR